jgi:hypothetical protein
VGQVLHGIGAPEEIRTPDPQIRSFELLISHGYYWFGFSALLGLLDSKKADELGIILTSRD